VTTPSADNIERFLSSLYRNSDGTSKSFVQRMSLAASHPLMTPLAFKFLIQHPIVKVVIPESEKCRAPWLYESRRPWNLRGFISSYVEIPSPVDAFWEGAPKKKLRVRTKRAHNAGYTARSLATNEVSEAIAQVFRDRGWHERDVADAQNRLPEPLDQLVSVGVFDPADHIVGFCLGVLTGNIVRTLWSCTSERGTVRWLLFSGYVREASARGVRFIIQSPPWSYSEGNQIFAGHLGFIPARIRSR
jgi:hypothetical protein